jgi:hypothetical protein
VSTARSETAEQEGYKGEINVLEKLDTEDLATLHKVFLVSM